MEKVKISLTNSKLSALIPSVGLPAILTCRDNAPCKRGCYACKGCYLYKQAREARAHNLELYKKDASAYFKSIIDFLNDGLIGYQYFRWHDSGDIIDATYFYGMIEVARACKRVKFLAFTKKYEIINDYLKTGAKIPSNLKIIFSAWNKSWTFENPFKMPVAYVFFKDKTKNVDIPKTAIECKGDCSRCLGCWSLKKGQAVYFNQH